MTIKPRGWQIEALEKFQVTMGKHFLLDATPGSGKTLFAAFAAKHLFDRGQIRFVAPPGIVHWFAVSSRAAAGWPHQRRRQNAGHIGDPERRQLRPQL